MKYTESGLVRTIQTEPISYNWVSISDDGVKLSPNTVKFKLEIATNPRVKILIGDNEVGWWFIESFNGKYFAHVSDNTPEFFKKVNLLNIKDEDIIFVEEHGLEYLLKSLYSIVDELLYGSKLLSIEIV